mgnify:CR=1 FL=1
MNPSLAKDAKDAKKREMFSGGLEQNKRNPIGREMEMPMGMKNGLLGELGVLCER